MRDCYDNIYFRDWKKICETLFVDSVRVRTGCVCQCRTIRPTGRIKLSLNRP